MQCPATMCPLVAPDGSPWTGNKDSDCPEDGDQCPWWGMGCSEGGPYSQIGEALDHGGHIVVLGANRPAPGVKDRREFDCPKEAVCQWQARAGDNLCPPREALKQGLDPRVVLF